MFLERHRGQVLRSSAFWESEKRPARVSVAFRGMERESVKQTPRLKQ